uniref:Uncharacterized protein n=1 Tax=Rhizophora mucronata TaxID=61149 RepID=A0A2P2NAM3_RHIMU
MQFSQEPRNNWYSHNKSQQALENNSKLLQAISYQSCF